MGRLIGFTSDNHGNSEQFLRALKRAERDEFAALIFGGDIGPKHIGIGELSSGLDRIKNSKLIAAQGNFLKNELIPIFMKFHEKNKDCKIILMLGNDDAKSNLELLKANEFQEEQKGKQYRLFYLLHDKDAYVCGRRIMGSSYVPLSPEFIAFKDWEKPDPPHDLGAYSSKLYLNGVPIEGYKSEGGDLVRAQFHLRESLSIGKHLEQGLYTKDPQNTIYIFHAPPLGKGEEAIDFADDKNHAGSQAIYDFILHLQPPLTFSGHMHWTVEYSGVFKINIGATVCAAVGNDPKNDSPRIITFDIMDPRTVKRFQI